MLATAAIVEAVAAAIDELDLPLVVVDPVIVSTSGERLLDADGVQMLIAELLPRAFVVTPNIPEAEALSGCTIRSADDARKAAVRLREMGAGAVIITGGHQPDGERTADVIDLLFDGDTFTEYRTTRIDRGPAARHRVRVFICAGCVRGPGTPAGRIRAPRAGVRRRRHRARAADRPGRSSSRPLMESGNWGIW